MHLVAVLTTVHPKPVSGCNVELSLLNSQIHGWIQKPLVSAEYESREYYRLGLRFLEPRFQLKNTSPVDEFIALDEQVRAYNELETLVNELGISEFATLKYKEDKMIYQSNLNFDYTKLRDMQNMDWAEESIKYGDELKGQGARPEEILKYYESAIDLDALNQTAHVLKGDILVQLKRFEDAKNSYKTAIKLKPQDKKAESKYKEICIFLSKRDKNTKLEEEAYPKMLLLQNGRTNAENYKMTFE